jgi:hypothetical protein
MSEEKSLVKVTSLIKSAISKPTYSRSISLEDYEGMLITEEESLRIEKHMGNLVTGASAVIPLRCPGGLACPFSLQCPYYQTDLRRQKEASLLSDELDEKLKVPVLSQPLLTPKGLACLVEVRLLDEWTSLYIDEYDIQESSFTDFQMVRELAETELMMWRINNNMSKPEHAEFVQEVVVGIDKQGNVLTRMEVDALYEVKERLQRRKSQLIKLMVGDRQEKYKREAALKQRSEEDPSVSAAQLRAQIDRAIYSMKSQQQLKENNAIEVTSVDILSPEDIIGGK